MWAGVSGEESEGEGREGSALSIKMQREKLEEEKAALLENKEMLKEVSPLMTVCSILSSLSPLQEQEKLLSEVQHREEQLKKEQKKRDQLASKIKAMESKLLAGSMERTDETKAALEKKKQEVIEQKVYMAGCVWLGCLDCEVFFFFSCYSVVSEKSCSSSRRKRRVLLRSKRLLLR